MRPPGKRYPIGVPRAVGPQQDDLHFSLPPIRSRWSQFRGWRCATTARRGGDYV